MSDVSTVPYYISIGITGDGPGYMTLAERTMVLVDLQQETITQAAKTFRKRIAKETQVCQKCPARLFWAVYLEPVTGYPFLHSSNTPKNALEKPEPKKKHKKDPTAVYLTDQAVQALQSELGPSILEKEKKNGTRNPRKNKQTPA